MFQRRTLLVFFEEHSLDSAEVILQSLRDDEDFAYANYPYLILEWIKPNLAILDVPEGLEGIVLPRIQALNGVRMAKLNYEQPYKGDGYE